MSEQNEKVHLHPNGDISIRHGEAPEPERTINPADFKIHGVISTPRLYLEHHQVYDLHVLVEYDYNGRIEAELNHSADIDQRVIGLVQDSEEVKRLKLGKKFSLKSLAEHLKLNKDLCSDHEEVAQIVSSLQKFTGKVTQNLTDKDDNSGSRSHAIEQHFQHDIQTSFIVKLPIYKGGLNQGFTVEILMDVRDGQVSVWLQSYGYQNAKNEAIRNVVTAEVEQLDKLGYLCIQQ